MPGREALACFICPALSVLLHLSCPTLPHQGGDVPGKGFAGSPGGIPEFEISVISATRNGLRGPAPFPAAVREGGAFWQVHCWICCPPRISWVLWKVLGHPDPAELLVQAGRSPAQREPYQGALPTRLLPRQFCRGALDTGSSIQDPGAQQRRDALALGSSILGSSASKGRAGTVMLPWENWESLRMSQGSVEGR